MPPQPLYIGQKAIFFAKLLFWVQLKVLLQLVANSFVFACDLTEASPGFPSIFAKGGWTHVPRAF